jgi:hypothetical protein
VGGPWRWWPERWGLSRIYEISSGTEDVPKLHLSCRDVLAAGTRQTEVIGPMLGEEAERVFESLA